MIQPDLLQAFARTILGALGAGILGSALLTAVILAATRLRRPSATTRHLFWWLALGASVALPLVSIAVSFGHIERTIVLVQPERSAANVAVRTEPAQTSGHEAQAALPNVVAKPVAAPATSVRSAGLNRFSEIVRSAIASIDLESIALVLVALWLGGSALGFLWLGRSILILRSLKRNASPLDEDLKDRLHLWRRAAARGRTVVLAVSNEVDVPVAVGFFNPTILLPVAVVEREAIGDIDQIAMHEYAHLIRRDDWTNLIQRACERLFWFNPILAFIGGRIALEREIACDDWVVAQTGHAHRYAACLWRLAESSRLPAMPILAPGALHSPRAITVRIEQLLDARRNRIPRLSPLGSFAIAALCVVLVVAGAQRAPGIALTETILAPAAPPVTAAVRARPAKAPVHRVHALSTIGRVVAHPAHAVVAKVRPAAAAKPAAAPLPAPVLVALADPAPSPDPPAATAAPAATTAPAKPVQRRMIEIRDHDVEIRRDGEIRTMTQAQVQALRDQIRKSMEQLRQMNGANATQMRDEIMKALSESLKGIEQLKNVNMRVHVVPLQGLDRVRDFLPGANLRTISLNGHSLAGANLAGADLHGAKLGGVRWSGVNLTGAKLAGADLRNARLASTTLIGADLRNADLSGATLQGVDLTGAHLDGANLSNAKLLGCTLGNASLKGANMRGLVIDNSAHLMRPRVQFFDVHMLKPRLLRAPTPLASPAPAPSPAAAPGRTFQIENSDVRTRVSIQTD
jgi:uncharacterized protein YjbI with pentapeptide repeats/beta-lactamase regulating signal transducer with metallopeptidase domain